MLSALCETEYTCGKHFMKMFPTSVIELESIIKVIVQSRRRSSPLCCVFKSAIPMRGFCFCYGPRKYATAFFFSFGILPSFPFQLHSFHVIKYLMCNNMKKIGLCMEGKSGSGNWKEEVLKYSAVIRKSDLGQNCHNLE